MWIYLLVNRINGKKYVGKTVRLNRRLSDHRTGQSKFAIGAAIKKYGFDNFDVQILNSEIRDHDELCELERKWIAHHQSNSPGLGYNLTIGGEGIIGRKYPVGPDHPGYGKPRSEETKLKIRLLKIGKKATEATRQKLSRARRGVPKSPQHAKAVADAKRGKPLSEQGRRNMSEAALNRWKPAGWFLRPDPKLDDHIG